MIQAHEGRSGEKSRDLLSKPLGVLLAYMRPMASMAVTGFTQPGSWILTGVWTSALAVMGVACVVNGLRCGRVHCYLMGPFFLLLAVITLLHGLRIVPLGDDGWSYLAVSTGAGSALLYYVPERIWGRYRPRRAVPPIQQ